MYAYTDAERAKEERRHQLCAAYLRQQFDSQPRGRHYDAYPPSQYDYGAAGAAPPAEIYHAPPPSAALREPSAHDKVWKVFEFLDANRDFRVDREEWGSGIRSCNVPFTAETAADLFDKAAAGGSDGITSSDWSGFSRKYPMLIDCLYHRFVSARTAEADHKEADEAAPALAAATRRALQEEEQAGRDLDAEREAAEREAQAQRDADAKRLAAEDLHKQRQEATSSAARTRADAQREVQQQWPEIQRRNADMYQAQRDADLAKRKIAEATDREQRLEQALADIRDERARAQRALQEAEEKQGALAARDGPDPEEELQKADKALADAQRQERDAAAELTDAAQFSERQRYRKDDADRRSKGTQARSEDCARAKEAAMAAEAANDAKRLQAQATMQRGPGKTADDEYTEDALKENKLVEEEVRLRQQRDELERRETVLREEHDSFTSPRKATPPRDRPSPASGSSLGYPSPGAGSPPYRMAGGQDACV